MRFWAINSRLGLKNQKAATPMQYPFEKVLCVKKITILHR